MKRSPLFLFALLILSASVAAPQGEEVAPTPAVTPAAVPTQGVVAYLGDRAITEADLDKMLQSKLLRIRQQEYDIKLEAVRDYAFNLQQEQEATRLGITKEELRTKNVTEKVAEPTKEEVQDIFTRYRSRLPADDEQARKEITDRLRERNTQMREQAWRDELLTSAKLRVALVPPRLEIAIEANDPAIGSASAPVTLVEFTDFQCPYCGQVQATLQQLRATYGDRLRFVLKQLPLQMHPQARLAAEASLCANDQGKFVEARDWLFGHRNGVTAEALKTWASEAKLDQAAFASCLGEHKHAKTVDDDLAYATGIEVSSTPTFFINGRLFAGARPLDSFKAVIDEELVRAGVAVDEHASAK